jgi:hypothetical protein
MPDPNPAPPAVADWQATIRRLVDLPLRVLLIGLVVIGLLKLAQWADLFGMLSLTPDNATAIAVLIFAVGLAVMGFLWYVTGQGFALLRDPAMNADRLTIMKELPLGLPEGTVRAILALIVGVIGLPLLLFMDPLGIPQSTVALVANIITGVFAFYFGQRTGGGEAQTARALSGTISTLQTSNTNLETNNQQLKVANTVLKEVAGTTLGQSITAEVERIERYVNLADTLTTVLGPVLPKGLVPDGLGAVITQARNVTAGIKALGQGELTGDTLARLTSTASGLLGGSGLTGLLSKAGAALLPMAGVGGPLAGIALLLSIGWKLESAQFRRWRARILAAPWDPALIDPGTITAITAETCLPRCPIFNAAFASIKDRAGFHTALINDSLADDAVARLWKQFGHDDSMFANEGVLRDGLAEFRLALLADQSARDIDEARITAATEALRASANPALRPAAAPNPAEVAKALDLSHARPDVPEDATAALHALVMLVGTAREKGIDLPKLLSEVPQ